MRRMRGSESRGSLPTPKARKIQKANPPPPTPPPSFNQQTIFFRRYPLLVDSPEHKIFENDILMKNEP